MAIRRRTVLVLLLGGAALGGGAALLAFPAARAYFLWTGRPAVERGREAALRLGCFGCHGDGGTRGIRNPGSREGEVPSWDGGTLMMYANDRAEIEAWILDGAPRRFWDDPAYVARRKKALIAMPAYRGTVSRRQLDDLMAFFLAQSQASEPPDPKAAAGREVAIAYGCFGCHGAEGRGFVRNPRSFKGYVPGWDGRDFEELVRDDAELEEWILDGVCRRLAGHPIAKFFLQGQVVRMPAYREHLTRTQVDFLVAYIRWMRAHGYPKAPGSAILGSQLPKEVSR